MPRRDESLAPARPTYAMRLGEDERRIIAAAAGLCGLAVSAYVRRAALNSARRELAGQGSAAALL